jgi:protein NrfD
MAAPRPGGDAWTVLGAVLGGLFFGAVLLTMNLGHWYLVSRSLPFRLLARGAMLFAVLAAARAVLLAAAVVAGASRDGLSSLLSLEKDALFFLFRVLWGIVGPLALSYFIWKTADMRSNQAATGLLYVALVFVLIGELLSSYLTVATGFPA